MSGRRITTISLDDESYHQSKHVGNLSAFVRNKLMEEPCLDLSSLWTIITPCIHVQAFVILIRLLMGTAQSVGRMDSLRLMTTTPGSEHGLMNQTQ